jgi:RNase H-fold protein (predicted Holliday junction resolvase)
LKLDGGLGSFSVTLGEQVNCSSATKEVSNRIKNFARELKMMSLKCVQGEDERLVISEVTDDEKEKSGWFLIDVFTKCKQANNCSLVQVFLEVYSSDFKGIEKARTIEQQVSETNWS